MLIVTIIKITTLGCNKTAINLTLMTTIRIAKTVIVIKLIMPIRIEIKQTTRSKLEIKQIKTAMIGTNLTSIIMFRMEIELIKIGLMINPTWIKLMEGKLVRETKQTIAPKIDKILCRLSASVNSKNNNSTSTTNKNVVSRSNRNTNDYSSYKTARISPTVAVKTDNASDNNNNKNKNSARTTRLDKLTINNGVDTERNSTSDENSLGNINVTDSTMITNNNNTDNIEKSSLNSIVTWASAQGHPPSPNGVNLHNNVG